MDPLTAAQGAVTVAGQVPRMTRLLRRASGADEFSELMRRVIYELRRDGDLPHEVRGSVADNLERLRVDPEVNGVVRRLIAESDADALGELERRLTTVFDGHADEVAPGVLATRVVHWVELMLPHAMSSDRAAAVGATRLMGGLIRRDVAEGFGGVEEHLVEQSAKLDALLEQTQGKRDPGLPPAVDWAPDWPRKALRALADADARATERLKDLLDGDGARERLLAAVADPPAWTREASQSELWEAVARYAEHFGEWTAAATVWERLAGDGHDEQRALWLLRAATSSRAGGDADAHRRLLDRAYEAGPGNPRVQLELAGLLPAAERRERIAAVVPDSDETAALKACHLGLEAMLARDLPEAERLAEEARRLAPDLVQVRTLAANVAIERNRQAIANNDPLEVELSVAARRTCLELRDELLPMRRWDETVRLLMLAADSHTVSGELDEAERLLLTSVPEEREAERGEVLAEAALRAMKWMTTGVFLSDDNTSLTARMVRARAKGSYGTADERRESAVELDAILAEAVDLDDRQAAALSRLVLCVRDPALPWSESAEHAAIAVGEAPSALGIKALWLTDNGEPGAAIAVVDPHLPDAWALEARYHVALKTDADDATEWAAEVLTTNPDQLLRLQCARTLEPDDARRAKAEYTTIARDRRAQTWVRIEAYGQLVVLLLNQNDPEGALQQIDAWQTLVPGDEKASGLRVTASARLGRERA